MGLYSLHFINFDGDCHPACHHQLCRAQKFYAACACLPSGWMPYMLVKDVTEKYLIYIDNSSCL